MPHITPLKIEIVRRRLIQADLAMETGIGECRLSRIVNGRVRPTQAEVKHLANALGIRREKLPV